MADLKEVQIPFVVDQPVDTANAASDPTLDSVRGQTQDRAVRVIQVGNGNSQFRADGNGIWLGDDQYATAPFRVSMAGALVATSATITGAITATSGQIGGFNITSTTIRTGASDAASSVLIDSSNVLLRLGPTSGVYITMDGANRRIRSSDYVAGSAGFTLEAGLVEAESLKARGELRGVTFKYDVVAAVGGQLLVTNSDILSVAMTALDASTMTISGSTTFAANDMLLIRATTGAGIQEEYMRVTSAASAPVYAVTRDLASTYSPDSNPAWGPGVTVVKIGVSDGASSYSGGWLRLFGNGTNSPYYSVFARTGVAYNAYAEVARFGNLNGIGGKVADTFGLFIGDASTSNYLIYDTVSGALIVNDAALSNQDIFGDGSDGDATISGSTNLTADMFYNNLTINTGVTLDPRGFRIFVKGTLTLTGTAVISRVPNDGGNGGGFSGAWSSATGGLAGAAGAALAAGSIPGGIAGVTGGAGGDTAFAAGNFGSVGSNGNSVAKSIGNTTPAAGAAGGKGGDSNLTGKNGGAAGSAGSATGTVYNLVHNGMSAYRLYDDNGTAYFTSSIGTPGSGGGASGAFDNGAGPSAGAGGGGGGSGCSGGMVTVFAKKITGAGTIKAPGGAGGNGGNGENSQTGGSAKAGGGGGGGAGSGGQGGVTLVMYGTLSGVTVSAPGGAAGSVGTGGSGANGGTSGSSGSTGNTGNAGVVIQLQV